MVDQKEIHLHTGQQGQMHDLTDRVAGIVLDSGIQFGVVNVFNVDRTYAITWR